MAELNLRRVRIQSEIRIPDYIISVVVDSEWGPKGTKLIYTESELDDFYGGVVDREGLIMLLRGGATLAVTKLDRTGGREGTLRLYNSEYKYSSISPHLWESIEFSNVPTANRVSLLSTSQDRYSDFIEDININESHTYTITLDFNGSQIADEDYIVIPIYYPGDPDYDNGVIFYFTDLNPSNPGDRKYPNDFSPSVELDTLGSKSVGIDINNNDASSRAELIYNWYVGNLAQDPTKYNILGSQGDSNLVIDQTILDTVNNKLTLVFYKPIRHVRYHKSNSPNPFRVGVDRYKTQDLIAESNLEGSIVTFKSMLVGDIDQRITLIHKKDFRFELLTTLEGDASDIFYVSLDRNEGLYNGESIFIEDVLKRESQFIKSSVHLGTKIDEGLFTVEDAVKLAGEYPLGYGSRGNLIPNAPGESIYENTINTLIDSEIDSNLFLFDSNRNITEQKYVIDNYLTPNTIIGIYNLRESQLENIPEHIVSDRDREFVLYTAGDSGVTYTSSIIRNNYFYAYGCISGDFQHEIPKNIFPNQGNTSINDLARYKINTLNNNLASYFVDSIINLDSFTEPQYLLVGSYIKVRLTRYLRNNLGQQPIKLRELLETEVSETSEYSTLISGININSFTQTDNNLQVSVNVELLNLVGQSIDLQININK